MKKSIDFIASIIPTDADIYGYVNGVDVVNICVEATCFDDYFAAVHIYGCGMKYICGDCYSEAMDTADALRTVLKKARENSSFDFNAVDEWSISFGMNCCTHYYGYVRSASGDFIDAVHIYIRRTGKQEHTAYIDIVGSNVTYVATDISAGSALAKAFEKAVDDDFFDFSMIDCWVPSGKNPKSLYDEKRRRIEEKKALHASEPNYADIQDDKFADLPF